MTIYTSHEDAMAYKGMSLRDYFAAHCPDSWIERRKPQTVGAMRDRLLAKGFIPPQKARGDVLSSYLESDVDRLMIALRYEYADAMMKERYPTPVTNGERDNG